MTGLIPLAFRRRRSTTATSGSDGSTSLERVKRLTLVFSWLGVLGVVVQLVPTGPIGLAAGASALVVLASWVLDPDGDRWWIAVVEGLCAASACVSLPEPQRALGFVFAVTVRRTLLGGVGRFPVKAVGAVLGYLVGVGYALSGNMRVALDPGWLAAALLPLVGLVIGSMALYGMARAGHLARSATQRADDALRTTVAVFEASPVGLLLLDHTGKPKLYNRRALPLLDAAEATAACVHGDDVRSCARNGAEPCEVRIVHEDGTSGRLVLRSLPIERSAGPDDLLLAVEPDATVRAAGSAGERKPGGAPPKQQPWKPATGLRTRPAAPDGSFGNRPTRRAGGLRSRGRHASELLTALADGQFVTHYQPIVDLGTGSVSGAEALVRWQRPGHGLVGPGEFIGLAETTGVIVPIGNHVLATACEQASTWRERGGPLGVTVNVSTRQLWEPAFTSHVTDVLRNTGLPPALLTLEVTETVWADEQAIGTLTGLRDLGVKVALDDFGTGYSSLGYLLRHQFDVVKIDRSFTAALNDNARAAGVVRCVIELAAALGARTVAEGVETEDQAEWLRHAGCTHAQGFLYGKAEPAEAWDTGSLR